MTEGSPTVLGLIPDLMFQSRVREQARALGYAFQSADTAGEASEALAGPVDVFVVDLHVSGLDWRTAVEAARERDIPVLAFGRHTSAELLRLAREAGCDEVVVRSTFVEELPELLRRLVES